MKTKIIKIILELIDEYNSGVEYYDSDGYVKVGAVDALETLLERVCLINDEQERL